MRSIVILMFLVCVGAQSVAQQQIFIVARTIGYKHLPSGDSVRIFGFNTDYFSAPESPGPTLIMNEGDSVEIEFFNFSQGAPHTIHLHGLDVNQDNDGVPMLSWDVAHMETGFYRFRAPHAGTYLYHCHVVSVVHVQAGMFGLIIVRPPDGSNNTWNGGYGFDQEHTFFMSELDTNWHVDSVLNHDHDTTQAVHYMEIPKYDPQWYMVNGVTEHQIDTAGDFETSVGAVNYLRMSNIGYYGNRVIFPADMNAQIISTDGRPLPSIEISDTLEIYPGERYGILSEANNMFVDSIAIEYFDLNTGTVHNTQYVEVAVDGIFGVNQNLATDIEMSLYPNPAQNETTLEVNGVGAQTVDVTVLDVSGKTVVVGDLSNHVGDQYNFRIVTENLPAGVYLVHVQVGDKVGVMKLVKE